MDALVFAIGGLCFLGLVLLCGAYLTKRMHARWEKKIQQTREKVEESLLELQRLQKEQKEQKKRLNALLKTKEREG